MTIDQTTFNDLSIFTTIDEESVFHRFDYTITNGGKYYLQKLFTNPSSNISEINDTQKTIQFLSSVKHTLPTTISNGTIMVIEKFYETHINPYPTNSNSVNSFLYSVFSKTDYSLTRYSLSHFHKFVKGLKIIEDVLENNISSKVDLWKEQINFYLKKDWVAELASKNNIDDLSIENIIKYASNLKYLFKQNCLQLIELYCSIDAYVSIAIAAEKNNFHYPVFIEKDEPYIEAEQLYHLLLSNAVAYDIDLKKENNFLFLTGANMAGKSTFIKAIGVAVYLAHLGLPVPAQSLYISLFEGLLSNINIADNIFKHESYFFNEVQRIKSTVEKIGNNKKWLILIDELFKGTNIQDAMKCSKVVIEGLQGRQNAVFVLSTHLYEIGEELRHYKNIQFKYFQTSIISNELHFSYNLKDGISNDKLGYLILQKEGVVDLLKK